MQAESDWRSIAEHRRAVSCTDRSDGRHPTVVMSQGVGQEGKEIGMKLLLTCAAIGLLTLSACDTPEGESDEDERTEQRGQDDNED